MNIVYKNLDDFEVEPILNEGAPKFIPLLKSRWDEITKIPNVFRYKIDNLKERLIIGDERKYYLQLNPDRATNRRTPELISKMSQPFSNEKFNFSKVSSDEVMFSIGSSVNDPELHSFIVNVSPISQYHTLFCPFINKKLPQAITQDSLWAAIRLMFIAKDSSLKIGFNSLCGLASVNHLHFHLFMMKNDLPVQHGEWESVKKNLCYLVNYPVTAFCFDIEDNSTYDKVGEVYRLIKYLQDNAIAHNILMNLKRTLDVVEIYVFPRKNISGAKQLTAFNVAVLELSGWFPVFSEEAFKNLKSEDLENEMMKWEYDDFEELLRKILRTLYNRHGQIKTEQQ